LLKLHLWIEVSAAILVITGLVIWLRKLAL
jgi:hypothetical protein